MKISILSAVFNEADFIDEMIDSVIAQTEDRWELLLVDDGSSDDTVLRIERRARGEERVVLVCHGEKLGKVEAFNRAFQASSGDVVVLLGGDDRLPKDSLAVRAAALSRAADRHEAKAAAFRLRTFSDEPRFHDLVLPKGKKGNLSGGTIALTRPLAEQVFPIPRQLVAEDIWIAEVIRAIEPSVISGPEVVLEYRIHSGNSNPRQLPFRQMTASLHDRALPYQVLLESDRYQLDLAASERLQQRVKLEDLRFNGKIWAILRLGSVPLTERLRAISSAHPVAFWLRRKFYALFSGFGSS